MHERNLLFIIYEIDFIDNFGIAILSAVAKQAGWNTHLTIFDRNKINDVFKNIKPQIVCYSSMSSDSGVYLKINKYLKSRYEFISIMGGPHPTFFPEVIQEDGLDFICIGEGELAFQEFLDNYKNGRSLDNIQNFCSKRNKNPLRNLIQNLDDIPLPDRTIIFDNTELKNMPLKIFMTSRGCPYLCSYCYNDSLMKEYKDKGPYLRTHSVERVMEEISIVKSKYPLEFIKFEDDIFGINMAWLEKFSETYRREIGLPFNCLLRIDLIGRDRVNLLKNAKCRSVTLAIDSANERIRNEVLNRQMKSSNEEIIEKILLIKDIGINVMTNSIIGIPTSSIEDEVNGVALNIKSKVDYANTTMLVPYPKTAIWDFCSKNHMLNEDARNGVFASLQQKSILTCFSDKEKDIRWNISAFFPAMVKFPFLKCVLVWIAKHSKSNILFSFFYVLTKSYLMKRYIFPCKISLLNMFRYLIKALRIEIVRMLGIKRQLI